MSARIMIIITVGLLLTSLFCYHGNGQEVSSSMILQELREMRKDYQQLWLHMANLAQDVQELKDILEAVVIAEQTEDNLRYTKNSHETYGQGQGNGSQGSAEHQGFSESVKTPRIQARTGMGLQTNTSHVASKNTVTHVRDLKEVFSVTEKSAKEKYEERPVAPQRECPIHRVPDVPDLRCPKYAAQFGNGMVVDSSTSLSKGFLLEDPVSSENTVYHIYFTHHSIIIRIFSSMEDIAKGRNRTLQLNKECRGATVRDGHLYCIHGYLFIKKYNISTLQEVDNYNIYTTLSIRRNRYYSAQLLADENALWLVWADPGMDLYEKLAKLNPTTGTVEGKWVTNMPRSGVDEAFIICGILYAGSVKRNQSRLYGSTYIRYVFDPETSNGIEITSKELTLPLSHEDIQNCGIEPRYPFYISYHSKHQALYARSCNRYWVFPIEFVPAASKWFCSMFP